MAKKLTDTVVRSLELPSSGQRVVWDGGDGGVRRFGLRLSAGGTRAWVVKYKVGGRSRWLTLGQYPLVSLSGARTKAKAALAKVVQGEDPAAERRQTNEAMTFDELAKLYLEKYATPERKRSWKEDARILAKYVPRSWRATLARDITRRQARELVEEIAERGAPIQANRVLAVLRKVFNFAIDREIVDVNPFARIKRPSPERRRDRVLAPGELRRLWAVLDGAGRTGLILKLILYTAKRPGEVKKLRWEDVDLDTGLWVLPAEFSKNKLVDRVPLTAPAVAILRDLQASAEGSRWVFPSTSESGHIEDIKKGLDQVRRATGEPCGECESCGAGERCAAPQNTIAFIPRDLRRTVATYAASELGVPPHIVGKLLNHADSTVTMKHYVRTS